MLTALRPHQREAMDRLRASLGRGNRRPVLQAPTGAGKTVIAAAVVDGALAKGNRVVFVVPMLSLIDQTVQMFWREGIQDVGVIQADHPLTDWSKPVQVASVQTLQRREFPKADVVVIDECHKVFKLYERWMKRDIPFIGLSATPWTKGLGRLFDDLIAVSTTTELIDQGYLCPFRVFAPSHPDLTGVRTVAGDYHEGELGEAMNQAPLVADVVTTWLEKADRRPTLVYGVDRAHAKHLQQLFEEAGVKAGYQDAYTDALERENIRKRFEAGDLEVVCNVATLTTGVDWDVRCLVIARPTKSEMLHAQIVGRGLRTAPGKPDCLILDHSDNHLRLGLVTDIHHDRLDDGRPQRKIEKCKESLPKECPKCAYLKPPKIHKCPSCGFAPERKTDVEIQDGELVELRRDKSRGGVAEWTGEEKRRFYGELRWIAQERGYKEGWAYHKYIERLKIGPATVWGKPLCEPSEKTRSWVRSRQIAWAKKQPKKPRDGVKAVGEEAIGVY